MTSQQANSYDVGKDGFAVINGLEPYFPAQSVNKQENIDSQQTSDADIEQIKINFLKNIDIEEDLPEIQSYYSNKKSSLFKNQPQKSNSLHVNYIPLNSHQYFTNSLEINLGLFTPQSKTKKNSCLRRTSTLHSETPKAYDYSSIDILDLSNSEHQQVIKIIVNILSKTRPKNTQETDILSQVIENLPFFKNHRELLSLTSTSKELLQSLKLEYFSTNDILFSKGSAYCLLGEKSETKQQQQDIKQKMKGEEANKKKLNFNIDFKSNLTFESEQILLKQQFPSMNLVKIYYPGESFGEIALITQQPRTATIVLRQNTYLMTLSKDAYNKIIGQYDQIVLRDRRKFLMSFSWFKYHTYSKLLSLLHFVKIQIVSKKYVLYKEGDIPEQIYFVKQGEVEISKTKNLDELLEQDNDVQLNEWKNQRKTSIYKLNKIQQIKDRIESILKIQVSIIGYNNCFGEEDIILENPKRTSTAVVISAFAEIFSIEKQKLLNDLTNHQTLDGFILDAHLKHKQQQISHEKNIQAALAQRKSQILHSFTKKSKQKTNCLSQVLSPTNYTQKILPKIQASKNTSFIQQTFGQPSHREQIEDMTKLNQETPKPAYDKILYAPQTTKGFNPRQNLPRFNFHKSYQDTKYMKTLPNENLNQSNHIQNKMSNLEKIKDQRQNQNKTDTSGIMENEINLNNSLYSSKKGEFNSIGNRSLNVSKEYDRKNTVSQDSSPINEKQLSDFINEDNQKNNQSKRFKSISLNQGKLHLPAIRKEEEGKRHSKIYTQKNIDEMHYKNQLKLVDLNTRSLDLTEISSELLKIYIQKHSTSQVEQSLQNITASRLLQMSSTLRRGSNNPRLFMKQTGQIPESKFVKEQSRVSTPQSIHNEVSPTSSPKSKQLNSIESDSIIQRRPTNISLQIPNSPLLNQELNIKRHMSEAPCDFSGSVQQKESINQQANLKQTRKSDFRLSLSTTLQYRYFKKQVDFLENSEKYIEEIKKASSSHKKLNEILNQNTQISDENPISQQKIRNQNKQLINQSLSLLAGEMFKGSASSIKNIKLQRHHSLIFTGQISSQQEISPRSAKLKLTTRKSFVQESFHFQNKPPSLLQQTQFSQRSEQEDDEEEETKKNSEVISEKEELDELNYFQNSSVKNEESQSLNLSPVERKQSQFFRSNDIQQTSLLQILPKVYLNVPQISSFVQNSINLQPKNDIINLQRRNTKQIDSSFKIEYNQQNSDIQESNKSIIVNHDKLKQMQKKNMFNKLKKQSQPIIAKLLSSIQQVKPENQEDMHYLGKSINVSQSLVSQNDHNLKAKNGSSLSPRNVAQKYINSFSHKKGDEQHYQKIIEQNYIQKALFKQAKLKDRNSSLTKIDYAKLGNVTPVVNDCLSIQQKNINQQKQSNS